MARGVFETNGCRGQWILSSPTSKLSILFQLYYHRYFQKRNHIVYIRYSVAVCATGAIWSELTRLYSLLQKQIISLPFCLSCNKFVTSTFSLQLQNVNHEKYICLSFYENPIYKLNNFSVAMNMVNFSLVLINLPFIRKQTMYVCKELVISYLSLKTLTLFAIVKII